jgi:tetratricopeptide (TPR) repeat protein
MNYNQVQQHQLLPQQVVILQQQQQQHQQTAPQYLVNSSNVAILIPNNNIVAAVVNNNNNHVNHLSPAGTTSSQHVGSSVSNDPPTANLASSNNVYLSLLGLADSFLKASQYRFAIHCLESILTLKFTDVSVNASFHIFLKTRLNLCRLYLKHTLNTNQYVNAHIEKAIILVQNLSATDEYKYEATYIVYKIFQKQKDLQNQLKYQQQVAGATTTTPSSTVDPSQLNSLYSLDLARHVLESSSKMFPLWHARILFLIGNLLLSDKDYSGASYYMSVGIEFCAANRISQYTHIMFILSKGLVSLDFLFMKPS